MTDKILKEAFDKLTAIEEGSGYDTGRWDDDFNYDEDEMRGIDHNKKPANKPYQNYKPEEANDEYDKKTSKWSRSGQYDHLDDSNLHDAAIDLLDDMLAVEEDPESADILRYAIKRLQEVGLGR